MMSGTSHSTKAMTSWNSCLNVSRLDRTAEAVPAERQTPIGCQTVFISR